MQVRTLKNNFRHFLILVFGENYYAFFFMHNNFRQKPKLKKDENYFFAYAPAIEGGNEVGMTPRIP